MMTKWPGSTMPTAQRGFRWVVLVAPEVICPSMMRSEPRGKENTSWVPDSHRVRASTVRRSKTLKDWVSE